MVKKILVVFLVVLILIQFFQPRIDSPPIIADLEAETEIKAIFIKSCYDCHSNQLNLPWYTKVMPIGWIISNDIAEARRELNFSVWGDYEARRKVRKLNEMKEEIEADNMPLPSYLFMHGEAELTESDKKKIYDWITLSIASLEKPVIDSTKTIDN